MSFTYLRLAGPSLIPTSTGPLCTGPAAKTTYAKNILLYNGSGGVETVQMWLVPSGTNTAGASHKLYNLDLSPNETLVIETPAPGHVLNVGDTIHAKSSSASAVVKIDGGQE